MSRSTVLVTGRRGPWTLVLVAYLILIALFYRGVLPSAMQP